VACYYGVYGYNALAVFDTWDQTLDCRKYFKNVSYKKFSTFSEAEDYAIEGFIDQVYSWQYTFDGDIPEHLVVNKIVLKKNM